MTGTKSFLQSNTLRWLVVAASVIAFQLLNIDMGEFTDKAMKISTLIALMGAGVGRVQATKVIK